MVTITSPLLGQLVVSCTRCDWTFRTHFGPLAAWAADLHQVQAHPRHAR